MQSLNNEEMSAQGAVPAGRQGYASGIKKNILKYSLFGFILIFGFFSWFSVYRAMKIPEASIWLMPIIWFSLYVIAMCLAIVLVRQEIAVELAITFSFLLSLIFTFSIWYFAIFIFCVFLMLSAVRNIRKDLDLNIKISLWKSLLVGKFKIIIVLALLISSQYFFFVSKTDGQKTVPKFNISVMSSKMIEPILGIINPDFKKIKQDGITVDKFILENQNNSDINFLSNNEETIDQQIPADLPSKQREALKQQALQQINDSKAQLLQKNNELIQQQGRKQLSEMVGRDLKGDEKIADVFAGFIDKKINDYFQPQVDNNNKSSSLLSYIVAAVLFLTIWPIGSVLGVLWFAIVIIIFKILLYFGLVEITTVTVEREMIA